MTTQQTYFLAACAPKGKPTEYFDPMSYGREGEPDPDRLLRRGRGTLFNSRQEAHQALGSTLRAATDDGHEWPSKFQYIIFECETEGTP